MQPSPTCLPLWGAALLLVCQTGAAGAQAVVPDGSTSTTVSIGAGGRITVGIAGVGASGVSHNTYGAFSIPASGVNLNNAGVNANVIVNEVTSSRRSFLNGPLEVTGRQAHVVIANPNGITVDGARFINTGGVVLAGGRVRYEGVGSALAPIAGAGSGDILVEGAGLSGAMTTLQLIAGRIKIDGPITNSHPSPFSNIELWAGGSELVLDPTVSPASTVRPFVRERRPVGAAAGHDILLDITPRGSLSASRVKLAANGDGAGVRFAGQGMASLGEFRIDATGKISVQGAQIRAERSVRIAAASIEVLNSPQAQSEIRTVRGAITLLADAGNIDLHGSLTGGMRDADDPGSLGAITLSATGDIKLFTDNADRLAIAFAAGGDLVATAGGSVINQTGRLLANGAVSIKAQRLHNWTDIVEGADDGNFQILHRKGKRSWQTLWLKRKSTTLITADYGRQRIPGQLGFIAGTHVDIDVADIENTGEINALDGSVSIQAARLDNRGVWAGHLRLAKRCGITCWSRGEATAYLVGGGINATRGLSIAASERFKNERGQITAFGDVEISSPSVTMAAGFVPAIVQRPAILPNAFSGPHAWLSYTPQGGRLVSLEGALRIESAEPVLLQGGEIAAAGGAIIPGGVRAEATAVTAGAPRAGIGLFRDYLQ